MSKQSPPTPWLDHPVGEETYQVLVLDHPVVEERIVAEMSNGIAVYYDRRWNLTGFFSDWLLSHRDLIAGKRVLALGAGVGLETLVIGRHAAHLYINDLAPVSLELCGEQLLQNGITNFSTVPGRYETLEIPQVDLVVGCFLVYNRDTKAAMTEFVNRFKGPVLLINETLPDFRAFLSGLDRPAEMLFSEDAARGVLLPAVVE